MKSRGVTEHNSISPSGTEHVILLNGPCADLRYKTRQSDGRCENNPLRKQTAELIGPQPQQIPTMQNTTTAVEKRMALIAAREARLEAEQKRAEEEKLRAAAEAMEIAELEKQEEEERKAKEEAEKKKAEEAKKKAEA